MRVGIIGTGAIAHKHAEAYRNIGYRLVACAGLNPARGKAFAEQHACEALGRWQDICTHPQIDFVDLCTFPDFRLEPVELGAQHGKHVQVQKPIATTLETAARMIESAARAGILLGVVSQHRFDESIQFLKRAIVDGRLGRILEADAYVKWHRSDDYYKRPVKGTWQTEGGGALINQAIHQLDLLLWLAGPVREVSGQWQIGAAHRIEAEDIVNALIRYQSGATGVIQAATAFHPGYPERLEIHGTRGTAIVTGDRLTTWDVIDDFGDAPPLASAQASGASNPMAISLAPFERQFLDFGEAIRAHRRPAIAGEDGYRALEMVCATYRSCREGRPVSLAPDGPHRLADC
jgi:UDP-N-acetyl-2-amino-2-deoxyglucuronate dehydrogenase